MHPLRVMLDDAFAGRFPAVDGDVEVFEPDSDGHRAIVEFTGHAVVLGNVARDELVARGADGFGGVMHPEVVLAVAGGVAEIGCHDALLVASGRGDAAISSDSLELRLDLDDHPRVVRSRRHRSDVSVFADDRGLVTIGTGLVGRREMSVELFEDVPAGTNAGRTLINSALGHVEAGGAVWAQVSPGNAASLRTFLAVGFRPVGAEMLLVQEG